MLVWSSWLNLSLRKRKKQQLKTTTTVNLIKPQVNAKRSLDAYGSTSVRATRSTGMLWARAHITLLLRWRIKFVMVKLLYSSATIAEDWSEVLISYKVSSWLLAQEKVALRQEMGWTLPSQTGPGLDCGSLNHLEGSVPHSPAQAGQNYHVTTSSTVHWMPVKSPMV